MVKVMLKKYSYQEFQKLRNLSEFLNSYIGGAASFVLKVAGALVLFINLSEKISILSMVFAFSVIIYNIPVIGNAVGFTGGYA